MFMALSPALDLLCTEDLDNIGRQVAMLAVRFLAISENMDCVQLGLFPSHQEWRGDKNLDDAIAPNFGAIRISNYSRLWVSEVRLFTAQKIIHLLPQMNAD